MGNLKDSKIYRMNNIDKCFIFDRREGTVMIVKKVAKQLIMSKVLHIYCAFYVESKNKTINNNIYLIFGNS